MDRGGVRFPTFVLNRDVWRARRSAVMLSLIRSAARAPARGGWPATADPPSIGRLGASGASAGGNYRQSAAALGFCGNDFWAS